MATASAASHPDRNVRRLDCLARVHTTRRVAALRRQRSATELELAVRRAEQAARRAPALPISA